MLVVFEPIHDLYLDTATEQRTIREEDSPLNVGDIVSLGSSRGWVVVDRQFYSSPDPFTEPYSSVCVAFVAPLDEKVTPRSEWDVSKLLESYPDAIRYVYLDPGCNVLQSGWKVGGEVSMERLKTYIFDGSDLLSKASNWQPTIEYCYYHQPPQIEFVCYQQEPPQYYKQVSVIECRSVGSLVAA